MLTALFGAGLLARVRQTLSGPLAAAIGTTGVALIVVGAIALGLHWLRGDAAADAVAVCEAGKLQAALDAERTRAAALEAARRERDEAIEQLTLQRSRDETTIAVLTKERADAIDRARDWERQIGRDTGVVFRADDPWLRQARTTAGANRTPGR